MARRAIERACPAVLASLVGLASLACLTGCGASQTPGDVSAVQTYLTRLADGQYGAACDSLAASTRRSLGHLTGARGDCAAIYTRCLPYRALRLGQDQSQLLFATVEVTRHGSTADAGVSGTATARAIRRVTLAEQDGRWQLTSPGDGLKGCRLRVARRYGRARGRAARHPAAAGTAG